MCIRDRQNPEYEFVPYKYGCFSFSANADLNAMVKKGLLSDTEASYQKIDETDYLKTLKTLDRKKIEELKNLYGNMDANSLMKHTSVSYTHLDVYKRQIMIFI